MQLYVIRTSERDWVAADSEVEALAIYQRNYDLDDDDMTNVSAELVTDPASVTVTRDSGSSTAAEVMAEMRTPGFVASSAW